MSALLIALSLVCQAKPAEPIEPLPPRDDPEIRRVLGRVYLEWNRAIREADKASDRAPVRKQLAIFEKLKRTKEAELRKRFYLAESDLKFIVDYGDAARLPKDSKVPPPTKPPIREELQELMRVVDAVKKQIKIEEEMYEADRDREKMARGIRPLVRQTMSADEFTYRATIAGLNPISIPEPPCGARTRLGTACTRKVPGGGPCWWHRDHPPKPMPPD